MRVLVVAGMVATTLLPGAMALPACDAATEQPPSESGTYLVLDVPRNTEVWAESNGVPGLQRQACEREPGVVAGPDTQLLETTYY